MHGQKILRVTLFLFNQKNNKITLTIHSNIILIVPSGVNEPCKYFALNVDSCFSCCTYRMSFLVNTSARPSSLPWDGIFYCVCTRYSHKLIVYFCALCTLNKVSQMINIIFEFFLALAYHVHTCINAQGIKSNVCLSLHDLPILIETRIITFRWQTCKVLIVRQFNIMLIFPLYTILQCRAHFHPLWNVDAEHVTFIFSPENVIYWTQRLS